MRDAAHSTLTASTASTASIMATEQASQHRSDLSNTISSAAQLLPEHKNLCDDLILLISTYNGTGQVANAETRTALWDKVFWAWDTNCPNPHPGTLPDRRAQESMIHVGSFNANIPPSTNAKKKASRSGVQPQTPPHRQACAPAYMKPNINMDTCGVSFMMVDSKSATVNPRYVTYKSGWTAQQARAEAVIHWDTNEVRRIGNYNKSLVTYWARSRLLRYLRLHPMQEALLNQASQERPVGLDNEGREDHNELHTIRTCASILEECAAVSSQVSAIAHMRGSGRASRAELMY